MRVKTLPLSTIPVVKCNHRWGAKMTFSHQTDSRYENSIYAGELYGFKNNVRLGAFITPTLGQYDEGITEAEATGLMRHDNYFPTDYWKNPTTGNIELIPDHYGTVWTQAGVDAFENAVLGASKAVRTPTCGAQMYALTNGRLGYDEATGTIGTSNLQEFFGVVKQQKDWLLEKTGRNLSSASYRNGVQNERSIMFDSFLGVRTSNYGNVLTGADADTWYGGTLGNHIGGTPFRSFYEWYPCTTRWWDYFDSIGATKEQATTYAQDQLAKCITQSGWFRDFFHWHSLRNKNVLPNLDEFLQIFRTAVTGNFVWTCSNGEAIEYMFVRELCESLTAFEKNGEVVVIADTVDKFKGLNYFNYPGDVPLETMHIPLSVEIDLSSTSLAGQSIVVSSGKVVSLGANKYIIEIPFHGREGFSSVIIKQGSGGVHNTSRPTATTYISGGKITLSANMPVRAVLFGVNSGGFEYDSLPVLRSNELKSTHEFNISTGKDYRIGIISEFGQASLITV